VLFGKWSGTEIKIDVEDFVVAKESDIMGVVEEPAPRKGAPTDLPTGRKHWGETSSEFVILPAIAYS
jgi:hypothetical protein